MKLRLLAGSAAALLVVVACSGAENTGDLFAPSDSSNLGANPSTPGQSSSSGGTSSSGSSGTVGGDDDDDDNGSTSSASSSGTSGSTSSGGPKDAGPDAPPPANGGSIYCGAKTGSTSCTAGSQICCGSWKSDGKFSYGCEANGFLACAGGTTIACDDSSDCPSGQVCCGALSNNRYTSVECKATCTNSIGSRAVRFCDPKAAVDECAAIGKTCTASQSLPGYHVCAD